MKADGLQLNIISPEKTIFAGQVSSVIIPGADGRFGVLPDHAPLISPLKEGIIEYMVEGKEYTVVAKGGIAEVNKGVVTICVI